VWLTTGLLGEAELAAGDTARAREHLTWALAQAGETWPDRRDAFSLALDSLSADRGHARASKATAIEVSTARGAAAEPVRTLQTPVHHR
jgi:hypothetical protein